MKQGAVKSKWMDEIQDLFNTSDEYGVIEQVRKMIKDKSLTLAYLTYQIPHGPKKGKSVLWGIARLGLNGEFVSVWNQFKAEIRLEHFLVKPESEESSSALLWLAWHMMHGKPEAFIAVWDQFKDHISLEVILECWKWGNSVSILFCMAAAVAKGKPEVFRGVWNNFKESIPLEELVKQMEAGACKGESVLLCLASMPQNEDKKSFGPVISILKKVLAQNPKIKPSDLPEIKSLIDLIIATSHEPGTEEEVKVLFALAKIGQANGYVDAFYDVGEYFESIGNLTKAFEAYELISPQSPHYQTVCLNCGESRFAESTLQPTQSLRNNHLKESLKWALQIQDKVDRLNLIRKIASFYILGSSKLRSDAIISDEQLMLIKDKSEVDFCFAHFDIIKKQIEGEKELKSRDEQINALKARLQKEEDMNALLRENNAALLLSFKKLSLDEGAVPEPKAGSDRAKPKSPGM